MHIKPQVPLEQVAVACAGAMHWWPHVPQFCVLFARFTHAFPHGVNPELHRKPHVPLAQVAVALAGGA